MCATLQGNHQKKGRKQYHRYRNDILDGSFIESSMVLLFGRKRKNTQFLETQVISIRSEIGRLLEKKRKRKSIRALAKWTILVSVHCCTTSYHQVQCIDQEKRVHLIVVLAG